MTFELPDPTMVEPPASDAYWVVADWLAAGPHPHADDRPRLNELLEDGFEVFINLTAQHIRGSSDRHLRDYTGAVEAAGGVVIDAPIQDMGLPSLGQARTILDAIDSALTSGQKVYVHCWAGVGRTGTIVGCWLVRHGIPNDEVASTITTLRYGLLGDSPQSDDQLDFIQQWSG